MIQVTTKASVAVIAKTDLQAAEAAVDDAIIRTAELVQNLIAGRRASGVGVRVGQPALMRFLKAMHMAGEMRGELGRGHDALEATAKLMGLTRADYGPFEDKGDEGEKETPRGALEPHLAA